MTAPKTPAPRPQTDPALARDAHDLQEAVSELVRIYQFRDRTAICYYDISVTQCHALAAIATSGRMMLTQLAEELLLDKSTASRVVGALVKKGYVARAQDPRDARALRLEATPAGRRLHGRILADLEEEMGLLVADVPPGVRRETIRLVARLAEAAAARFGHRPDSCKSNS